MLLLDPLLEAEVDVLAVSAAREAGSVIEMVVATTVATGISVPDGEGMIVTLVVTMVRTAGALAVTIVESRESVAASVPILLKVAIAIDMLLR